MTSVFLIKRFALALAALSCAAFARGGTIEFTTSTASPNSGASANTNAYGSDANVSVGYSEYTYNYTSGYGGLGGGTGDGIYSDNTVETLAITFTAAAGYTVTLDSFDLAQYFGSSENVDISVTGGTSSYSLSGQTPLGGSGNFTTYSPAVTGSALTLTVTNLYDVGMNEIVYSEASTAPEPSTALLAAAAGGIFFFRGSWRRRKRSIKSQGDSTV